MKEPAGTACPAGSLWGHIRLALLAVPVPLEQACNPLVLTRSIEQANACVYARSAGPRVEAKLRSAVELCRAAGGGKVPKLLLPHAVLWGRIPSVAELMRVLTGQLALPAAPPQS